MAVDLETVITISRVIIPSDSSSVSLSFSFSLSLLQYTKNCSALAPPRPAFLPEKKKHEDLLNRQPTMGLYPSLGFGVHNARTIWNGANGAVLPPSHSIFLALLSVSLIGL